MQIEDVKYGIIHCSATRSNQPITARDIDRWHRERGWNGIGYHLVIERDGRLSAGRKIGYTGIQEGAHARGWNEKSIGICLVGGLDERGKTLEGDGDPMKVFTLSQVASLRASMLFYARMFPGIQWIGHRDTGAPKACPCFDVRAWLAQ